MSSYSETEYDQSDVNRNSETTQNREPSSPQVRGATRGHSLINSFNVGSTASLLELLERRENQLAQQEAIEAKISDDSNNALAKIESLTTFSTELVELTNPPVNQTERCRMTFDMISFYSLNVLYDLFEEVALSRGKSREFVIRMKQGIAIKIQNIALKYNIPAHDPGNLYNTNTLFALYANPEFNTFSHIVWCSQPDNRDILQLIGAAYHEDVQVYLETTFDFPNVRLYSERSKWNALQLLVFEWIHLFGFNNLRIFYLL